jgi:hypothetical protein
MLDAQVAVRGCGFGSGGRIYTLASGRRGRTWLYAWVVEGDGKVGQIGGKVSVNDEVRRGRDPKSVTPTWQRC